MLPNCKIALSCRRDADFHDASTLTKEMIFFCPFLQICVAPTRDAYFFNRMPPKLYQNGFIFLYFFLEFKYRENKPLACTPARSCILLASNVLIFLRSRQVHFGPGMQVKLEILCFRVKNIKKNARILNLSFEGMSHAKLMFFKKHVENSPENRQAREATLWGMSYAKLMV